MEEEFALYSPKAFNFWSRAFLAKFLTQKQGQRLFIASSFQELVFDLIDRENPKNSLASLELLEREIENPQSAIIKRYLEAFAEMGVEKSLLTEMIQGAKFELSKEKVLSRERLLVHCFQTAGVLGLMMVPAIGAKETDDTSFAVNMGMAIKLSELCASAAEDAQHGRRYLPEGVCLKQAMNSALELAQAYFNRAREGIPCLPLRSRAFVLATLRLQEAHAKKITIHPVAQAPKKVSLSSWEKAQVLGKTCLEVFSKSFWFSPSKRGLRQVQ